MEFTVNGKKFTDYNEAKAYEESLKQKEAEAKRQEQLNAKKEVYTDEIVNLMNFCVVDFDNEKMTSPRPRLIFAFMAKSKNKSDFATMANAYIESACEKRFYVEENGDYGEYYSVSFPSVKSKAYDELNGVACGAVLDYLLNNGHKPSVIGKFIPVNEELGVMFYDLVGVDDIHNNCSDCKEDMSYDDLPDEVKSALEFIARMLG